MLRKSLLKNAFDVISIVKVHTIKWQIYPDEVFYAKDLLPARVTISFFCFSFYCRAGKPISISRFVKCKYGKLVTFEIVKCNTE